MSYKNSNSEADELQAYFEQQNDKEAASIVAAVIALLPSSNSWDAETKKDDEKEQKEQNQENDMMNAVAGNVLNNILLTKESEIAALKEVIFKWRNRAFEAESNARIYYLEQLELIEVQHENELKLMESRFTRKLYEKDDIISALKEQVNYSITCKQLYQDEEDGDTESYVSTIEDDTRSMISSVYDRDVEQRIVVVENGSANSVNTPSKTELKSENIFNSIQVTMRAIEEELNFHTTSVKNENCSIITSESMPYNAPTTTTRSRHRRRSPAYNSTNTYYSSATLIDSDSQNNKKISKKSSFFINRIFKKAFPKLFKKNSIMNIKYPSSNQQRKQQKQQRSTFSMESIISCDSGDYNSSYFPRSSTDETLNVYSTTNSSDYKKPVNVLDLLPAMNSNNTILA